MNLNHKVCRGCEYYHCAGVIMKSEGAEEQWYCEACAVMLDIFIWEDGMQFHVPDFCPRYLEHVVISQDLAEFP